METQNKSIINLKDLSTIVLEMDWDRGVTSDEREVELGKDVLCLNMEVYASRSICDTDYNSPSESSLSNVDVVLNDIAYYVDGEDLLELTDNDLKQIKLEITKNIQLI